MNTVSDSQEMVVKYSKDHKEVEEKMGVDDLIAKFMDGQTAIIGEEKTQDGVRKHSDDSLDDEIRKYCKEHELDYNGDG